MSVNLVMHNNCTVRACSQLLEHGVEHELNSANDPLNVHCQGFLSSASDCDTHNKIACQGGQKEESYAAFHIHAAHMQNSRNQQISKKVT